MDPDDKFIKIMQCSEKQEGEAFANFLNWVRYTRKIVRPIIYDAAHNYYKEQNGVRKKILNKQMRKDSIIPKGSYIRLDSICPLMVRLGGKVIINVCRYFHSTLVIYEHEAANYV